MSINKKIYLSDHNNFFDKLIQKKRGEIVNIVNKIISQYNIENVTDVGTTSDFEYESSNYIIRNISRLKNYKSISNQTIPNNNLFDHCLRKSITDELSDSELSIFSSDLIISSATIEHVGSFHNQIKMVDNMIKLSKKIFILTTPNRYYPLEFHTKIPFIHWLPKKFYRKVLFNLGFKFFSNEENLNLLSNNDFKKIFNLLNFNNFKIWSIKLLFIKSNLIIIGFKNE